MAYEDHVASIAEIIKRLWKMRASSKTRVLRVRCLDIADEDDTMQGAYVAKFVRVPRMLRLVHEALGPVVWRQPRFEKPFVIVEMTDEGLRRSRRVAQRKTTRTATRER